MDCTNSKETKERWNSLSYNDRQKRYNKIKYLESLGLDINATNEEMVIASKGFLTPMTFPMYCGRCDKFISVKTISTYISHKNRCRHIAHVLKKLERRIIR